LSGFERVQQRRYRQLALAVDADVDDVLGIELEIEPRAAIRDHARGEEIFAAGVRLATVMIEEARPANGASG
jgi:site-specific recombinase XerC